MPGNSEKLLYGATSASAIFGSALMWSWWDLAFYSGIFFNWQPGAQDLIIPSFSVGMLASGITLLLFAVFAKRTSPMLYRGTCRQLITGAMALAASLGSIASAWLKILPLALLCSAINGYCLAVLLALWGTLWSERGARSAIIATSLSISLGIAIDGVVLLALKPLAASLAMCVFPLASLLIYLVSAREKVDPGVFNRNRLTKSTSRTVLGRPIRYELFGVSLLMLLGLTIGELAFNFMNCHFAYDSMSASQGLAFNYSFHLARAIGAFACFVFVGLFHVPYKRFFWVGIMAMCCAFAIAPFLEALGLPPQFCNYVNQACFAIVAIFEISVFCEISYARQTFPLESVGFGMVFITGFIVPGLALGVLISQLGLSADQYSMVISVAGYAVILGLWAAVSEGQRYLDPEKGVAAGSILHDALQQQLCEARRQRYENLVAHHALTQREMTVLDELLLEHNTLYIANKLDISENTVKTHIQNIYKKFAVHTKAELISLFDTQVSSSASPIDKPAIPLSQKDAEALTKHQSMDSAISQLATTHALTAREQEVFALLARGYRHKEVARKLVISLSTVHTHVTNVYAKLDAHSQDELSELVKAQRESIDTKG